MLLVYLSHVHIILNPPFLVQMLQADIFIIQHPLFFVTNKTCLGDKIPHYLKHPLVIE